MTPDPILRMSGIHKAFVGVKALDDVDLRLFPGEVHALMGENGAGKSTLIKVLTGVYDHDAGEIALEGRPGAVRQPDGGAARRRQHRVPGGQPVHEPLRRREPLPRP